MQWALFAEGFKEGKAHIDLSRFGVNTTLLLNPGPGFGDLSHPTTQLMLKMMQDRVANKTIIDIGTGSGILTLAALMLGANTGLGIDIDLNAIIHAKTNAKLNHLENKALFSKKLPNKLPPQNVFLMNMIFPEQKGFDPSRFNAHANIWIISGILAEQKEEYFSQAEKWGWDLLEEHHNSGWMGLIYSASTSKAKILSERH